MDTASVLILILTLAAFAVAGDNQLFEPASLASYAYEATLLMNEVEPGAGKDVGYQISGHLSIESVWASPNSPLNRLLLFKLMSPKLSIKSRKAPAPEGFVTHTSKLEELKNGAFLVHWKNGQVKSVFINQNEPVAVINLKKGVASMFQFQSTNQEVKESDASGMCTVQYTNLDGKMIEKIKTNCQEEAGLPTIKHPDTLWSAAITSHRRSVILLTSDLSAIDSVESEEKHSLAVPLREEAGGALKSYQSIKLLDRSSGGMLVKENNVDAAVKTIEKSTGFSFAKHSLVLSKESSLCADGTCPQFSSLVKENRDALKDKNLGTTRSASAFIKLLTVAREAKKEELVKALKNNKNKDILFQLVDLLGAVQTQESHEAALHLLDFRSEDSADLCERYLWALSLGSHPSASVITDLLRIADSITQYEKLSETIFLTVAAMTSKLRKLNEKQNQKTISEVLHKLTTRLKDCSSTDENCHLKYIRALKNLDAEESVPLLLSYVTTGSKRISVSAINAIHHFPPSYWSPEVLKTARRIYFQLDKQYDSSARTLSLDILLEKGPSPLLLEELLLSLQTLRKDPAYEVKQYLMQRLKQIGDSDLSFASSAESLMKSLNLTTNYHVLSQRGLSTAFTRSFMRHPSANGTLSTIQEMSGGIVKRGLVDVIIEKDGSSQTIFSLGLFTGGLASFLSSDDSLSGEEGQEEETATAGMDLTVMGVQVRPFVFFSGQGELMGHVWSGTASEKTPAFQAIALLQDHVQFIPLEAGFIAELNLQGAISFDLSGQISISIWNRNSESLVEKSAGLSVTGLMRVNTQFVNSQVQFNVGTEVALRLFSTTDFSGSIAICLQLQQPASTIKHNVHKIERIPGSKHRLRKSKYKVIQVPGRTYTLNQKNNELCNVIFA